MNNILILFGLPILVTGCALFGFKRGDDPELAKMLTRYYSGPKAKCAEAVEKTFKAQKGMVERRDDSKGLMVSSRFDSEGQEYHASTNKDSSGQYTSVQQQHQLYVKVLEKGSQCGVRIYRTRAWSRGKEIELLPVGYATEHVWDPFFKEVNEQIRPL